MRILAGVICSSYPPFTEYSVFPVLENDSPFEKNLIRKSRQTSGTLRSEPRYDVPLIPRTEFVEPVLITARLLFIYLTRIVTP